MVDDSSVKLEIFYLFLFFYCYLWKDEIGVLGEPDGSACAQMTD